MYLITISENLTTGRFHPFIWRPAPTPSDDGTGLLRYRSKAHHTGGFDTLEAAKANVSADLIPRVESTLGPARFVDVVDRDSWADNEVPARTIWADR